MKGALHPAVPDPTCRSETADAAIVAIRKVAKELAGVE
jgi:hypothetical protein